MVGIEANTVRGRAACGDPRLGAFSPSGTRDISRPPAFLANSEDHIQWTRRQAAAAAPHPSPPTARIVPVNLGRIAWLMTVCACLVAVLVLVLNGYYGYAGVTLAVAVSAAINLV